MGTPEFAVPSLEILLKNHKVSCVITQPDKPKGRKLILTPPPIKVCAMKHNVEILQPLKIRDQNFVEKLQKYEPDLIVVVAYKKILPKEILEIPKFGCVNVHSSLLPKYRGAAPIHWSIINGEKITGVTTMFMGEGWDTGDTLLSESTEIAENETTEELTARLAEIGAKLLFNTIDKLEKNNLKPTKQDEKLASRAPNLDKNTGKIDWKKSAQEIHNLIRGLIPWPVAYTYLNGKKLKVYKSEICDKKSNHPGEILCTTPLIVGCGDNKSIRILELQIDGKKRMFSKDFINGHKISTETVLD